MIAGQRTLLLITWMLVMVLAMTVLEPGAAPVAAGGNQAVVTAWFHTCALTSEGGLKCWGWNAYGGLGDGTNTDSNVPLDVAGLTGGVESVSTGWAHTCALTTGGGVECWGPNLSGELGNGASTGSNVPIDVVGLAGGAQDVSAGGHHTCALTDGGGVKCWGTNVFGELGAGTYVDSNVPVDVAGLASGVQQISAGGHHTCAIIDGGGVKCWGMNIFGQLGTGTYVNSNVPVDVSGLAGRVQAVSAGGTHTCALTEEGGVKCWGRNDTGQLGTGTYQGSSVPVDVVGLTGGVQAVAAGDEHTCALTAAGGVKCWGSNGYGELGNGTNAQSAVPVDVVGLTSGVQAVSAGDGHTCALTIEGGIKCWGRNDHGELGDGTNEDSTVPVDTAELPGDVNCDGVTDSVDAALVLQFSADLIDSLAGRSAGDVNQNGSVDAVDAALILQFVAGVIDSLPP